MLENASTQVEPVPSSSDLPGSFSLLAAVHLPVTVSAEEIMDECEKRIKNPLEFKEVFEERIPPPEPPKAPTEKLSSEQVYCLALSYILYPFFPITPLQISNVSGLFEGICEIFLIVAAKNLRGCD